MNWIKIDSESQLKSLMESSEAFAIFKHSTRCPISSMVKNRLERDWSSDQSVYYLDLLAHRDLSNLIAKWSGVPHESPQIIVFKGGKPVYHASHTAITAGETILELE